MHAAAVGDEETGRREGPSETAPPAPSALEEQLIRGYAPHSPYHFRFCSDTLLPPRAKHRKLCVICVALAVVVVSLLTDPMAAI